MKRLAIILAILLVLAAAGAFFYTFRKTTPAVVTADPATTEQNPSVVLVEPTPVENTAPASPLSAISNEPVVDFWINSLDGQAYYITATGLIRRAGAGGETSVVTSSLFDGGVHGVSASPRGDAVIIEGGLAPAQQFKVLDIEHLTWRALPEGTTAAAWSPTAPTNEIAFLRTIAGKTPTDPPISTLGIYNLAKGTSRTVTSLNYQSLQLAWINASTITLSERPTNAAKGTVWAYDLKKATLQTLVAPQSGLWIEGNIGFDAANGSYLLNSQGGIQAKLPFLTTPTKCVLDGVVYCAVITNGITRGQLPDSYLQRSVMSIDSIVGFPLSDLPGIKPITLFDAKTSSIAIDAWHLRKYKNNLYFINRYDGKLYELKLPG